MSDPQRIGILGSGEVGRSLAEGFARHGWSVVIGTRDPTTGDLATWADGIEGDVIAGTFAQAAQHGDVVVLAARGSAGEDVVALAGVDAFAGTLVLDAMNPLDMETPGGPGLLYGLNESLGERIQALLPDAQVVKCFNTVPNSRMIDPSFDESVPEMLIAGNDGDAKKRTEALLISLGWPGVIDVGDITAARWLEALVPLWARVGMALDTWGHVWKVVR